MLNEQTAQSLFFVWQPQDFTPATTKLIQKNNIQVILDVSQLTIDQFISSIQDIEEIELKLSLEQFFSPPVADLLKKYHTKTIWVEYFQQLSTHSLGSFLEQTAAFEAIDCNVITGDLDFIHTCFTQASKISGLAIKGSESSGFVSSETILTLLSHLEKLAAKHSLTPKIHIWGGIATPEGACTCLASGVSRVIFESLHWLTDKILVPDTDLTKNISNIRLDHTSALELAPNLQLRFFDKGNSVAGKTIKQKITDTDSNDPNATKKLVTSINSQITPSLQADYDGEQLILLGPEASFASSFVERFGQKTTTALPHFARETARLLADTHKAVPRMLSGEITKVLGIQYPFIQGAMACISDVPGFALSIVQAGGLPTIAMGIKSMDEIKRDLSPLKTVLQGHPYAINVITLPENPHRDEQLAWLEENKPPFVVISAGDPGHAAKLQDKGIAVIYVTSDIDLLQLAWAKDISIVICEGQEAGGHVGTHSTLTLAQAVLELQHKNPTSNSNQFLVLAGGISDTNSLARAALLGADGVQMGTLYLSSLEIVSSGALSKLYQQTLLKSSFGNTTLTGESVGLRVRAIASPKTEKIRLLENKLQEQTSNKIAIRHQLEQTSIGSLLIAARNRHPESGELLSEDVCYREGQFMCGAIGGNLQEALPLAEIHQQLAANAFEKTLRMPEKRHSPLPTSAHREASPERISITGMAIVNSLGNSPEEIWQACLAMKSGISEIPAEKWNHDDIFEANSNISGKTYCKVGALISLEILRKELNIPPHDFRTMTASTKLTLWLAHKAIHESTLLNSKIPSHRIGVIVSQNAGEMGSTAPDITIFTETKAIADAIRESCNLSPEQNKSLEKVIRAGRLAIDDTTLLGRLNCAAAGFICNKYGFTGPSYSVTSACASSLTALYNGVQLIRNGVLDAAIVGGGEELLTKGSFLEFSALGALAGKDYDNKDPAAFSRPFDKERSGMVLGEGGGLIVIERESVARERGVPILAHITGVGASNNHQGMVESVAETQMIAINGSFQQAGYGPEQIDMVECHATGTHMGDREEVNALKKVFPPNNSVVLSSFKSQIGHTLGASGISSLIRGVCAMRAGIFPPTLNYNKPDPSINLEEAGFKVCKSPEPWTDHPDRPKRFEVNAFGFGGANYVVQIENEQEGKQKANNTIINPLLQPTAEATNEVNICGVSFFKTQLNGQLFRIAAIDSPNKLYDITKTVSLYQQDLTNLTFKQKRDLGELGIRVKDEKNAPSPLAVIFSGQGSHYSQMGKKLYHTFPVIRHWMDVISQIADIDILQLSFQKDDSVLQQTEYQQPALFILEYAIYMQLRELGLQPTAMAGHSMGELTALCAAGCFSYEDAFKFITKRAQCMAKASKMVADPGLMLAVNAPKEYLNEKLAGNADLFITNFNSPRQTVIGGSHQEIQRLKKSLDQDSHWNIQLPVSMAFHSPTMKIIREELGEYLSDIDIHPPQVPVLSNTTRQPYPTDATEIRQTILAHLESPVHWQDNVSSLINNFSCRQFLEIGPQDTLCTLVRECSTSKVLCLSSCSAEDEVVTLRKAISSLYVRQSIHPKNVSHISLSQINEISKRPISKKVIHDIIQQEIYSFALHGTERYLKPAILQAIQQQLDPDFNEEALATYMPAEFIPRPPAATTTDNQKSIPHPQDSSITEQVIKIIMDATGYERDEIQPDMDIRNDLAIKSSRIPVIVDEAEKRFNITTTLEDFLTVQTVQDLADRIAEFIALNKSSSAGATPEPRTVITESNVAENIDPKTLILENVIQIIMDSTGYERDEIEAEMDIRNDLAIKSSRIPIIVDAAEQTFNITTTLEDFLTVRTVQDLADRIASFMENDDFQTSTKSSVSNIGTVASANHSLTSISSSENGINRLVPNLQEVTPTEQSKLQISAGSRILLLSFTGSDHSQKFEDTFTNTFHSEVIALRIEKQPQQNGSINLFDSDETILAMERIAKEGLLTGVILLSDKQTEQQVSPLEINSLVTGFFTLFQQFLKSSKRKFCIHIHRNSNGSYGESQLNDSILGLHLTAAREYKTLCLRSVTILDNSGMYSAVPYSFDLANPFTELFIKNQRVYTCGVIRQALTVPESPSMTLSSSDIIIISGGGQGITSYLARSLAPFGCTLILLGRSSLSSSIPLDKIPEDPDEKQQFIADYLEQNYADLSSDKLNAERQKIQTSLRIQKNITEIEQLGATVQYISCNVAEQTQVSEMINTVTRQHGTISGIIHGAGIIKDSFISLIRPEMFKEVMDVKLLGVMHLLDAVEKKGLRFVLALSSIAAFRGNIGQANYCIANRAMSAYLHTFKKRNQAITTKVLWLPPIEGAGMADHQEIKDILLQNMGKNIFIEVHEAAEIMLREILSGPIDDCWIVPLRDTPPTKTVPMEPVNHNEHWFNLEKMPMLDTIKLLDLRKKTLHATRTISSRRDLWLANHKPSKLLRHPIMSAIMVVESFLETNLVLFPHLLVTGLQNIQFLNMIECPQEMDKEVHLFGQGQPTSTSQQICTIEMKCGRRLASKTSTVPLDTYFQAEVVANTSRPSLGWQKVTNTTTVLLTRQEIKKRYEQYSNLTDRYQVLETITKSDKNIIQGTMLYPDVNDFSKELPSSFHYPHYLLEALMQISLFFTNFKNTDNPRTMVPVAMDNISFSRNCRSGEELFLDGKLKSQNENGTTWDMCGIDKNGLAIMKVIGLQMKWVE